jgi:hypothetical protein
MERRSPTRPWQVGGVDARHEKRLGPSKASHRSVKLVSKIDEVIRDTVRQLAVGLCPNKLRRVELRRVGREVVRTQAWVAGDEGLDFSTAMGTPPIPEERDRAAAVSKQVPEERPDVQAVEVARTAAQVEAQAPPPGRDRQARADRQTVTPVPMLEVRGLAFGRPRPTHIGNQQKPALIDEDKVGSSSVSVFLSVATRPASTERWPARRAPQRGAPAFDNSSPAGSGPSRRGWRDSARRSAGESVSATRGRVQRSV